MCNREIKFGVFRAWAKDHGFSAVATGHYARRVEIGALHRSLEPGDAADPAIRCSRARTKTRTSPTFSPCSTRSRLRDARFPIGHLAKPELRRLAREAGLATADKKDSQGICFIGEVKMQDFLRAYVPDAPGPIVRANDGRELGRHRGLHYYTLGQRKGIGVPSNTDHEAYVVVGKRAADRALLVAFDHPDAPGLFQREVRVHSLSWTGEPDRHAARTLEGRVRYRDPRVALEFIPEGGGTALVTFPRAAARPRLRPDPRALRRRAVARRRRLRLIETDLAAVLTTSPVTLLMHPIMARRRSMEKTW